MRIDATFPGATIVAAAEPVADPARRTISGVAVPWNTIGRVASGELVMFHPGSLDATARPPALRDHDRTRPIGVVADAADTGELLAATIRASRTRDGDDALVLAADGALPMFSVGAEPTEYHYDDAGVLHVTAAEWLELSLLTHGAFIGADVVTVTATNGGNMPPDTLTPPALEDTDDPTVPVDPTVPHDPDAPDDDDTDDDDGTQVVQQTLPLVPVTAGRRPGAVAAGRHPFATVGVRELAGLLCAASATGDPSLVRRANQILMSPGARTGSIQAALVDVGLATTTNVNPAYRPAYQAELVELVSHGSPLVDAIRQGDLQRGDYPNKIFTRWITGPAVDIQDAEKDEINSVALEIGPVSVPVATFATGNDLSQQLLDFGAPSFVEDYIRAAGVDYAEAIQAYASTALLAVAANVTTVAGDTFVQVVGKLVSALNPASVPAGGLFLAVSWDVWAGLIGVPRDEGPAFWSGSVSFGSMLPSAELGGLSVFYSPGMPPRTYLLGLRNAATWYDLPGTPFSLRAVNVGQLGLDVAVYGYGALGVQYPSALVKTQQPATP